jgi:hypothetical protein
MKSLIALLVTLVLLAFAAVATADPAPDSNGCHGFYTTQYKELTGDRGAQGEAIGGKGNSDGDPANGQAHSEAGRGATLQTFLAGACQVGSQAP